MTTGVVGVPVAPLRAVGVGLLAGCAGLVLAVVASVLSPGPAAIALGTYLLAGALVLGTGPARRFGLANAVTLTRLVGTCWIVGLMVEAAVSGLTAIEQVLMICLGATCLVLDGVDGRIARIRGEESEFGARFDVETDALQLLSLALAIALLGAAGWWVLAVPGLRYAYLVGTLFLPALRIPLVHGRLAAKVVAVVGQVSLLVALAADLLRPGWLPSAVVAVGLVSLCWSFGRDVAWQLRHLQPDQPRVESGSAIT